MEEKQAERTTMNVVGTRSSRVDAVAKVTGQARFGTDVNLPGRVVGKILRSPHAHARILEIDTRQAESMDGVYAVLTAEDLPPVQTSPADSSEAMQRKVLRDNTLARDKVLYAGHPVAAVAARTSTLAEEALRRIKVSYEVLPPVVDVRTAMQDDAPVLHPELRTRHPEGTGDQPTNVSLHFRHVKGDPEIGFDEAEVVVEREFTSTMVHQGYLEPHASTAVWEDGRLTIYATTQGTFAVRSHVTSLLQLPMSRVRVIPMEVGGAFGGKNTSYVDGVASLLARKARRPVRVVMSRYETFVATGPTPGTVIRVKMGADRDGRITAVDATLIYEAGAYPGAPVGSGAHIMFAPYDIPHAKLEGFDVVVNKPKTASYRAPGATPANFATESVIDELAAALEMDPLDFRLKNTVREGSEFIDGGMHANIGAQEVLEAAKGCEHLESPLGGPNRGRGVAHGFWGNWGARSSCAITVNADGTVALVTGSVDITGTRTSIAMQVAEVLGLTLDEVKSTVGDTDTIGYSDVSAGSRTTVATGRTAVAAAHDVIDKMRERVSQIWAAPVDDVGFEAGTFVGPVDEDGEPRTMTFKTLAGLLPTTGNTVIGVANLDVQSWGSAFGTHIVDVEVDPDTGKVDLLRYTVVQDVGRAINPVQVEGQLEGGTTQGIGWALYEGYDYDEQGRMTNPTLLDYKLPTALDVPSFETVLVEVPYPDHPFGARGVGEMPIVPPPAAIANAIHAATGHRVCDLPMSPARVLESMGKI